MRKIMYEMNIKVDLWIRKYPSMTSKGIAYKMFAPIKFFFENGMKTKHKKFNFDQMSIQKKICFTCLKLYTEKYHSTNVW